jgi:SPP1 gp7 family putative phage head morphogenesis protein
MARKPDEGHKLTDKELTELEGRITSVYKQAADDMQDKVNAYFAAFQERDAEQKSLIGTTINGKEYTESEYKQWRLAQIGRGERYQDLQGKLAERYTKANETAVAYINDATPSIYSLNRNYAAYTIEQVTGDVGFTMWDESTVKRLIVEQPDIMPYYPKEKAINRGIDLDYGKRQITKQVTSGIMQGESIKQLSDRLQKNIPTMERSSAIRAARTAVTGAQNAGRMDSYEAAKGMGIKLKKEWLATLDNRTRHEHAALDGQQVDTDEPFEIDGYELMYPGDPDGEPEMIYNCRCTLIAAVEGVDTSDAQRRARNAETGENELISDMTYSEWAGWKQEQESGIIEQTEFVKAETNTSRALEANGVEYNTVRKHEKAYTDDEIIDMIAGGDKTTGSCASVALAYAGQKQGLNVLDFRGGESMKYFSSKLNKYNMFSELGVTSITVDSAKSNLTNGKRILKQLEEGKEYYLSVGMHAAIVRNNGDSLQYLELQSAYSNGWKDIADVERILKYRFGCSSSSRYVSKAAATDISQLQSDEFRTILGFINTNSGNQLKGASGSAK